MFRDRPLTWLFILATIIVDLVMSLSGTWPVFEGIRVGQVAAIAIWAAIGHSHRLTRGSLLVVAVGVLAFLPCYRSFRSYSHSLTFMAAYALVVMVTSLVIVWLRTKIRIRFDGDREQTPLKIPLIEFFGWTIVVAIISFGARHMSPKALEMVPQSLSSYLLLYAVAPIALVLFDSRFRRLHLAKAMLFVGGVYLIISYLIPNVYVVEVTSVAAYLTAWLLVRSIEYDQLKTAEEDEDSEEQNGESIKLFDAE